MNDQRMDGFGTDAAPHTSARRGLRRVAGGGRGGGQAHHQRQPAGGGRGLAAPPRPQQSAAPTAAAGALSASDQAELAQFRIKKGLCPTCGQKTHKINVLTRKRVPLTIEGKCLAGTCLKCNQILPRDQASVTPTLDRVFHDTGHGDDDDDEDDDEDDFDADLVGERQRGNVPRQGGPAPLGVLELTATRGVIPSEDEYSVVSGLTMDPALLRMQSRGLRQSTNTQLTERPENYIRQPHLSALTEENDSGDLERDPADLIRDDSDSDQYQALRKIPTATATNRKKDIAKPPPPPQHDDGYDTGSDIDDHTFDIGRHYFGAKEVAPGRSQRSINSGSSRNNFMDSKICPSDRDLSGFDVGDSYRWSGTSADRDTAIVKEGHATKQTQKSNSAASTASSDPKPVNVYGGSYEDVRNRIAQKQSKKADSGASGAVETPTGDGSALHYGLVDSGSSTNDAPKNQTRPLHDHSRKTLTTFDPPSLPSDSRSAEEAKVEIEETKPPELATYRTMTSAEIREIEDAFEALEKPSLVSWRTGGSGGGSSRHGSAPIRRKSSGGPNNSAADTNVTAVGSSDAATGMTAQHNVPGTEEAPVILYCLHAYPDNSDLNEKAFNALFTLATSVESRRESEILSNNGVKCIVDGLWRHMEVPTVQEAGLFALWALAVSEESGTVSKGAKSITEGRALDATLISMQTHLHFPSIQYAGCGILSCLARAAKLEKQIDDGTSSGAMFQVVCALDMHSTTSPVQEWGIRALANECENSTTNKMNLVRTGEGSLGDGGDSGMLSIYKAMKRFPGELAILEWGLRLIHCVSSYENAAVKMSASDKPIDRVIEILEARKRDPEAMRLCEEGIGALSNLSAFEQNNAPMRFAGTIKTVSNIMMHYPRVERIQVLSCRLLANLAIAKDSRTAIVRSDAPRIVLSAMRSFSACAALQEEACRLLRALCAESSDGRASVSSSAGISSVVRAMTMHAESSGVQEQAAGVFAGMASEESWSSLVASSGALATIPKAMNGHPQDRSLQEICCVALRNLSTSSDARGELTAPDRLEPIIRALELQEESEIVQENACGILWNLSTNMSRGSRLLLGPGDIKYIVKAMQNFPESPGTQKAACGALWSLSTQSDDIQNAVASNGGIDAIMCTFLLHQDKVELLELACGVLCSLSVNKRIVKVIADAGCIGAVTELIRTHMSCSALFQTSCLFLHNIAFFDMNYAEEASAACSSIVRAMKENPDDATLIRAACCALSSLAANAEACRERIHACGGVSTIARAKERFRNFADVWCEAEGALAQLGNDAPAS